jgi:hypothetical protein
MTRKDVEKLAPNLLMKWKDSLIENFIDKDPFFKYCSGPDCQCVAIAEANDRLSQLRKLTCESCKTSFCFQCGEIPHEPATCQNFADWNLLMSSSNLWVKQHSKPCPGCRAPIEKTAGCNHMKCSKVCKRMLIEQNLLSTGSIVLISFSLSL